MNAMAKMKVRIIPRKVPFGHAFSYSIDFGGSFALLTRLSYKMLFIVCLT